MSLAFLTNLIFPRVCLIDKIPIEAGVICRPCLEGISVNDGLICGVCHARIPQDRRMCHPEFPYLLGGAGSYEDPALASLIHHLKFRYIKDVAISLAEILFRYVASAEIDLANFSIIPIPLSKKRIRLRGFNQS